MSFTSFTHSPPRQVFRVHVEGRPRPQGSYNRAASGKPYPAAKGLTEWKMWMAHNVRQQMKLHPVDFPPGAPLLVGLTFVYERPGTHFRNLKAGRILRDDAPTAKTSNPDLDKLIRAALDSLVLGKAIPDDNQVATLQAEKCWGTEDYVDIYIRETAT